MPAPARDDLVLDLKVTPLSDALGAEISGFDLKRPLSAAAVAAIKEAWNEHLVLVFRDQSITQDEQLRFAAGFGELGSRRKAPPQLSRRRAMGSPASPAMNRLWQCGSRVLSWVDVSLAERF
jgi:alpha-ketoglutarate-dependent taurine dioxygenase